MFILPTWKYISATLNFIFRFNGIAVYYSNNLCHFILVRNQPTPLALLQCPHMICIPEDPLHLSKEIVLQVDMA
jgi:hypothetical protein